MRSPTILKQIDEACGAAGIQPDLHLSGHLRLYEDIPEGLAESRFPISLPERAVKPPNRRPPSPKTPRSGSDASGNPLGVEVYNDDTFGFLRLTVLPALVAGVFVTLDPTSGKTGVDDRFTVDLHVNTVSNGELGGRPTRLQHHVPHPPRPNKRTAPLPKAHRMSLPSRRKRERSVADADTGH